MYDVIQCTKRAVFDSTLPGLTNVSLLVTSVLSNFICDAGLQNPDQILDAANIELHDHVKQLHQYALSHPQVRIVVVPPLPRTVPEWFNPYLPCFTSYLIGEIGKLSCSQIRFLSPFVAPAQYFEADGIHLTTAAGFQFHQFIHDGVDQVFPVESPVVPMPMGMTSATPQGYSGSLPNLVSSGVHYQTVPAVQSNAATTLPLLSSTSQLSTSTGPNLAFEYGRVSSALITLTTMTHSMKAEAKLRRDQDNLVFARLKEDRDVELNKNRENRFTVSGLTTDVQPPLDPIERKEFFRLRLAQLVEEACPDIDPKPEVIDVYVNMRYGRGAPFLEGRMNTSEAASAFRVAASQLAREESPNFKDLFIANAVTLSTRVRIEILRAISKTLVTEDTDSYVQGFVSRPLLHYRMREGCFRQIEGVNRSYTFVEAVAKFGDKVSQASLLPAYRRARPAFVGCLEQYFVLLREGENVSEPLDPQSSNQHPIGFRGRRGASGWARGSNPTPGRGRHQGTRGQTRGRLSTWRGGRPFSDPRKRLLSDSVPGTPSKRGLPSTEASSQAETQTPME